MTCEPLYESERVLLQLRTEQDLDVVEQQDVAGMVIRDASEQRRHLKGTPL